MKYVVLISWTLIVINSSGKTNAEEPPFIHKEAKYRVVMVRHGKSEATKNVVSGWFDDALTEQGEKEARHVGSTLKKYGYKFDVAHASFLTAASSTMDYILEEMGLFNIEKRESWCLNIRHSGSLGGQSVKRVYEEHGDKQMDEWMHTYEGKPPPITETHDQYKSITQDPRYRKDPTFVDFPLTESLGDMVERIIPYWENVIRGQIKAGQRVLIVSHGPTLKGLAYYLEGSTDKGILRCKIPPARPFVYEFDENMNVLVRRSFIPMEEMEGQPITSASSEGLN